MHPRFARTALLAALLAVACSKEKGSDGSEMSTLPSSLQVPVEDLDAAAAGRALYEANRRLGDALALDAVDCEQARLLVSRICDLSARICLLAGAEPGKTELASRCEDGRATCKTAGDRVRARCD